MKNMILVALLVVLVSGCDSKPKAPFGFEWGQTVDETISQNLKGAKVSDKDGFLAFVSAESAPEPVQYEGKYFLSFTKGLGLTSATFSTGVDKNGYFFNQGRTTYNSIAQKLEEKYGKPKKVTENVERDGNEFYECIKNESCGQWEREYSKDGMKIILKVESKYGSLIDDFPKGDVSVRYEYLTKEMIQKVNSVEKEKEKSNNF